MHAVVFSRIKKGRSASGNRVYELHTNRGRFRTTADSPASQLLDSQPFHPWSEAELTMTPAGTVCGLRFLSVAESKVRAGR